MITAGVDAGSRAIKVVVYDAARDRVLASGTADQGVRQDDLATALLAKTLGQAGVQRSKLKRIVATGYGRNAVSAADETITEITCHARGVRRLRPEARSIVEIGGQDSKFLRLDESGRVRDFAMNDRCAAGTGRFLEVVAQRLEVPLEQLGVLAARSRSAVVISSTCVVFAETEIVGLLAAEVERSDIVAGVQKAIATRIAAMAGGAMDEPVVLTGGVAMLKGMAQVVGEAMRRPVEVCPQPQMTGALGAALLAADGDGSLR